MRVSSLWAIPRARNDRAKLEPVDRNEVIAKHPASRTRSESGQKKGQIERQIIDTDNYIDMRVRLQSRSDFPMHGEIHCIILYRMMDVVVIPGTLY